MWERTLPVLATRVNWNSSCHNWYLKEGQNADSVTGHYTFWMNISRTKKLSMSSANQKERILERQSIFEAPVFRSCNDKIIHITRHKLSGTTYSVRLTNAVYVVNYHCRENLSVFRVYLPACRYWI